MSNSPRKLTQVLTLGLGRLSPEDWDLVGCLNMARVHGAVTRKEYLQAQSYMYDLLDTLPFWKECGYDYTWTYLRDFIPGCDTKAQALALRKEFYFCVIWDAARRGL